MAKNDNEIGATFYASDVSFLLDPETTDIEAADFARCIAHIINGNYTPVSQNRYIRGMIASLANRVKMSREKYADISGKRQAAALTRWTGTGSKSFAMQNDANAQSNDANAQSNDANAQSNDANASVHDANASVHDANADFCIAINNINKINKSSSTRAREDFDFLSFWNFYIIWREHPDGRSLSWHSNDPNAAAICKTIAAETNGQQAADLKRQMFERNAAHMESLPEWKIWRGFWDIATNIKDATPETIAIYSKVIQERKQETEILQLMARQAQKIATGYNVIDLYKYLRKAQ